MRAMASLILVALASSLSFACTCMPNPEPSCERLRMYEGSALFVGEPKSVTVMKATGIQVTVFRVREVFSGSSSATELTVRSSPVCGYRFKMGQTYLVDARLSGKSLFASACGLTAPEAKSQDEIRFLRAFREHPDGAIVFGTVKEYVGAPNWVSPANRGISGAIVVIGGGEQPLELQVDESGWYQATGLHAGSYTVRVKLPSMYVPVREHSIDLGEKQCSEVDFRTTREKS